MPKAHKIKEKDPVAVALAAKRMTKISPARRAEIASNAAKARWQKKTAKH